MSVVTGYLTTDGRDLASVFMPIEGVQFSSNNFVLNTSTSPYAPYNITSSSATDIISPNISIGVWQISGAVVINRGSGTFGSSSYQQLVLSGHTGTGSLSTVAMLFPINGSIMTQIVCPMPTTTLVATSVYTLKFSLQTFMSTYSGTTGYIYFAFTKIGEVGGSGVSLNANNTFTGTNTFPGLTTTGPITLPTSYQILPTSTQIGGYDKKDFTTNQSITNNSLKTIGSLELPGPGVYSIMLQVIFTIGTGGGTMTRFVIEATTSNEFSNNHSMSSQYGSWALAANNAQRYTTTYFHSSVTTDTINGHCLFNYSGSAVVTGSIRYVRIA